MRLREALLAAGLVLCGAAPALANDDATAFAQAFCSLRMVEGGNALVYLASPALKEAIDGAMAENAAMQQARPDEKPPLGDGIPWQSHPDASDTCEPGAQIAEGDATIVAVSHGFADDAEAGWTDRLVLVPGESGVLLLDDIRYGEEGDSDTLRGVLVGVFSQ